MAGFSSSSILLFLVATAALLVTFGEAKKDEKKKSSSTMKECFDAHSGVYKSTYEKTAESSYKKADKTNFCDSKERLLKCLEKADKDAEKSMKEVYKSLKIKKACESKEENQLKKAFKSIREKVEKCEKKEKSKKCTTFLEKACPYHVKYAEYPARQKATIDKLRNQNKDWKDCKLNAGIKQYETSFPVVVGGLIVTIWSGAQWITST